jgi:hypothetical protein
VYRVPYRYKCSLTRVLFNSLRRLCALYRLVRDWVCFAFGKRDNGTTPTCLLPLGVVHKYCGGFVSLRRRSASKLSYQFWSCRNQLIVKNSADAFGGIAAYSSSSTLFGNGASGDSEPSRWKSVILPQYEHWAIGDRFSCFLSATCVEAHMCLTSTSTRARCESLWFYKVYNHVVESGER